ncbi:MAG: MarR family transcriptional regulator [Candidatus Nanohaloarchaeota archaeon QJJ-9]|nr:MarR family transcriptional regulator [Candidatus Nanohaloarchaeota archaeon QJJ-9]
MVSSTQITSKSEKIVLGNPSNVSMHLEYGEFTSRNIIVVVPNTHQPRKVKGYGPGGRLPCRYDEVDEAVVCDPGELEGNFSVNITYQTSGLMENKGEYFLFEHSKSVLIPTDYYEFEVVLPEGYGLAELNKTSIEPPDGTTGSKGREIYVDWTEKDPSLGDRLSYTVRYQDLGPYSLVKDQITLLAILGVLVLSLFVVFLWKNRDRKTIASILPVLKDDERETLELIIKGEEGGMYQKDLVEDLEYSKAKVSRLVKDLEERGLIKKEKRGRKNYITLGREIGDLDVSNLSD